MATKPGKIVRRRSGAGQAASLVAAAYPCSPVDPGGPCTSLERALLNVSCPPPDLQLRAVQCRISGEHLVTDIADLGDLLATLHGCPKVNLSQVTTLDLVAHSTAVNGYLKLGSSIIEPGSTAALVSAVHTVVGKLKFKRLRLAGCSTAVTEKGHELLTDLGQALEHDGVDVMGTTGTIGRGNFTVDGFDDKTNPYLMVSWSNLDELESTEISLWRGVPSSRLRRRTGFALDALPPAPRSSDDSVPVVVIPDAHTAAQLFSLIDFTVWQRWAGLLTTPLVSLRLPRGGESIAIDVLFDCDSARFSSGDIFRITDGKRFRAVLSTLIDLQ